MKLIASYANSARAGDLNAIELANDADPLTVSLEGVERIDLSFPRFTDGRAFSQAFLLRRRLGFTGEIRATGDVLIDQLVQMQRCGFDAAVLREDQNPALAQAQFDQYPAFYQGDAMRPVPRFVLTPASRVAVGVAA